MELLIQPADSAGKYTWKIMYGEKGADTRSYTLKTVDAAKGRRVVDENNGIFPDQGLNAMLCSVWVER